jgi:sulfoxide reductase heme-binding subunit YedZ
MTKPQITWLKSLLHGGLSLPLLWLVYEIWSQNLGTDPAEKVVKALGLYGAIVLWACLSMTPARRLTGKPFWIALRRPLGLWAFFYLSLHLLAFLLLWAGLDLNIITEEVTKRPYIYVGLSAWLILLPLAATSTQKIRRSMGLRWVSLHKLVYLSALLAVLHMIWLSKLDYAQAAWFALALFVLLMARVRRITKKVTP